MIDLSELDEELQDFAAKLITRIVFATQEFTEMGTEEPITAEFDFLEDNNTHYLKLTYCIPLYEKKMD